MAAALKRVGPGHPIVITPVEGTVTVTWRGHVVARTTAALALKETTYPVVHYIPRDDADMDYFERTPRSTFCPYKGDASYFTLMRGTERDENAVWSYEAAGSDVSAIDGHLAFYADRVTIEIA